MYNNKQTCELVVNRTSFAKNVKCADKQFAPARLNKK